MKEYIEKAAVEKFIEDGLNNPDKNKAFGHDAIEIMAEIHYMPAADVVEVVRCGECRHAEDSLVLWCTEHEQAVSRLDFCSHGARMDKEEEHETN